MAKKNLGGRPPNPTTVEEYLTEILKDVYKVVRLSRASVEAQVNKMQKHQTELEKTGALTLEAMADCARVFAELPAKTVQLINPISRILDTIRVPVENRTTPQTDIEAWKTSLQD